MTIGKYVFDPSMQAFLGDTVPYARRGKALALTELGWAIAFILGVPAAGFLITKYGWKAPFAGLACLGFAAFVIVRAAFPGVQAKDVSAERDGDEEGGPVQAKRPGTFRAFVRFSRPPPHCPASRQ